MAYLAKLALRRPYILFKFKNMNVVFIHFFHYSFIHNFLCSIVELWMERKLLVI